MSPPANDSPPAPSPASAVAVAPARILVVDDQPANLQVLGATLGRLGHEIIPAADGPTALRRLALRPPDLILLDLLMPGMDGCEVCRRVRENPEWQDIPVIFLSAADAKDSIVRALESGGVDYLTKPFNQAELLSRVRTHLELKAARDRLRQLAKDKDEILGILAHDLKNHLGGLELSAQLLHGLQIAAASPDPRGIQLAENIARTSGHLLAFLKSFLANSAADHALTLHRQPMDLVQAAAAALQRHREAALGKDLRLEARLPRDPVWILGDASAVGQVLDNLLSNAVKFSPPEKRIEVAVTPREDGAVLTVRDEGPGFTAEDRARMFQRYARLSARPTGDEPSTGLGLSIVRKLVEASHGMIECDSTPGAGATFRVRLPGLPAEPPETGRSGA